MRAEYNFTGGVRGKHYHAMQAGYTITIHKADGTTVVKEVQPKVGVRQSVPVLIDRGVLALEEIYAGGGADDVMLRLKVADLVHATGARLTDVI